jgi:peptidoglycan/LPS O-acetylase OafA/YrhL
MLGHALPFTDVPGWVGVYFQHGEAAVNLFFALSGLVIMNSLERFGGAFWPFMRARARRLLPVYFLVFGGSVVLLLAGDPLVAMPWVGTVGREIMEPVPPPDFWWHVAAHIFLVQGLIPQTVLPYAALTLLGVAWSLSAEWQFYVLAGLVSPRRRAGLALGLLALGLVYRLLHVAVFSKAFLLYPAPYFALGLGSAILLRGEGRWVFYLCLVGAVASGLLVGVEKALVPLAWGVVMLAQFHAFGAALENRVLQFLGGISYPLYLINEPAQRGLAMVLLPFTHGSAVIFSVVWLPMSIALSLAAAAVLHYGVELRFMRRNTNILSPVIAGSAVR